MFEKGEYVVYGSKGVCRIQEISHVDIPGVDQKRLYYICLLYTSDAADE